MTRQRTLSPLTTLGPNKHSCSGLSARSIPVGTMLLPGARARTGQSVQWSYGTGFEMWRSTHADTHHVDDKLAFEPPAAQATQTVTWATGADQLGLQSSWHTSAASLHQVVFASAARFSFQPSGSAFFCFSL